MITPNEYFKEAKDCDYKGEHYSVRDNGAIMRHPKSNRVRPKDNIWTFGLPNDKGYCAFCGEVVHRIVAFAFLGEPDNNQLVVDHIDTNRQNNRPENLRWVTKLENALNNPLTLRKILYYCTLQEFIENPKILAQRAQDINLSWMGAVTAEEARISFNNLKHLHELHLIKNNTRTGGIGNWIFNEKFSTWIPTAIAPLKNESQYQSINNKTQYDVWGKPINHEELHKEDNWGEPIEASKFDESFWGKEFLEYHSKTNEEPLIKDEDVKLPNLFKTSNKYAVQQGWAPHTNPEFPCCPTEISNQPLQDYFNNLKEEKVYVATNYGASTVFEFTLYKDKILVSTKIPGGIKNYALSEIEWNGEVFIHTSKGTFFEENGVRAAYTRAQNLEWDGPDSIDDYC